MNVIVVDAYDWANRIGDAGEQPRRSAGPLRGRHRPRARAPADELLRPRRGVVGRRGARRPGGLPQRLRHRRLAPDLPPGLPPRDLADPVGWRPRELRCVPDVLPLPVGAGGRQRRRHVRAGLAVRRRRRRPAHQADLPERGRRDGGRPGGDRRSTTPRPGRTCAPPRSCSRTGRSPSSSTTRARTVWDIRNLDFGDPAFTSWTVDIANDLFWKNRGQYIGRVARRPAGRTARRCRRRRPAVRRLLRDLPQPRPEIVTLDFEGDPTEQVAPHTGDTHWWGGAESQYENILDVDSAGTADGAVVDFWTWYFIEDGWDYGYLEALVDGEWVTVPLYENGTEVTTDTDPHDNNDEGNGLTGTSGGAYFVDDPEYVHLQSAPLPAGTTDVRFRYSTDAAYLDTGFFVDDVTVGGADRQPVVGRRQLDPDGRRAGQQLGRPDAVAVRPHARARTSDGEIVDARATTSTGSRVTPSTRPASTPPACAATRGGHGRRSRTSRAATSRCSTRTTCSA